MVPTSGQYVWPRVREISSDATKRPTSHDVRPQARSRPTVPQYMRNWIIPIKIIIKKIENKNKSKTTLPVGKMRHDENSACVYYRRL